MIMETFSSFNNKFEQDQTMNGNWLKKFQQISYRGVRERVFDELRLPVTEQVPSLDWIHGALSDEIETI